MEKLNYEMIVAAIALLVSFYTLYIQRKHNKLTFSPIPYLLPQNYLNKVAIKILNQGVGPLIIKDFKAYKNGIEHVNLISFAPKKNTGRYFKTYLTQVNERSITPNNELNLIEYNITESGEEVKYLEQLKKSLNGVEVVIKYTDVYGSKNKIYSKKIIIRT